MDKDPELEAMRIAWGALAGLEPEAQVRVWRWIGEKIGAPSAVRSTQATDRVEAPALTSDGSEFHPRVSAWMRQNGLSSEELDQVFFVSGDQVEIVAAEIPGRTTKDRVLNVYLLAGAGQFLLTGTGFFSDQMARELCRTAGCLDTTNHSKYLADRGNAFGGSKDRGWTLTQPGMKQAAALIAAITKSA